MSADQTEAQMIAGWLESGGSGTPSMHALRAARELRRLDGLNAELLEALQALESIGGLEAGILGDHGGITEAQAKARAAIAKATGSAS